MACEARACGSDAFCDHAAASVSKVQTSLRGSPGLSAAKPPAITIVLPDAAIAKFITPFGSAGIGRHASADASKASNAFDGSPADAPPPTKIVSPTAVAARPARPASKRSPADHPLAEAVAMKAAEDSTRT